MLKRNHGLPELLIAFVLGLLLSNEALASATITVVKKEKGYAIVDRGRQHGYQVGSAVCIFAGDGERIFCTQIRKVWEQHSSITFSTNQGRELRVGLTVKRRKSSSPPNRSPNKREGVASRDEERLFGGGDFASSLEIGMQKRYFYEAPVSKKQSQSYLAGSIKPSASYTSDNGRNVLALTLFQRIDPVDEKRTHLDIRTMEWIRAYGSFEVRLGIRQVTWGVTESARFIDVVNQQDFLEGFDRERKLGQPLANIAWTGSLGSLDLYLLPVFRPREFPGPRGRPASALEIRTEDVQYESDKQTSQEDVIIRYAGNYGLLDLGVYTFRGTNRDPQLLILNDALGRPYVVPYYELMTQVGTDIQVTWDALLVKLEHLYRKTDKEEFTAFISGLEYGFFGLIGDADFNIFLEYMRDNRGENSPQPYEDDIFLGLKILQNDEQDGQFSIGAIKDVSSKTLNWQAKASRRFGDSLKLVLSGNHMVSVDPNDPYHQFREDSHIELETMLYF